ncbi:MAG TPA: hypothetical protein VGO93_30885 [Candidatus Xenobia bacterium]
MIQSLWMGEVSNVTNDNTDVIVTLSDGRAYAFTAYTPTSLLAQMARDNLPFLVCEDLLVVRELTEANVRAAIEHILETYDIERLGIRQTA